MSRPHYQTVWAVMIFGWISNYLVRAALSPVLIPLMQEFSLTYSQAGLLASAFFYAYALMQFPAGFLGDRLGKKRILIGCALGWGLTSIGTALAPTVGLLFLFRFLTGLAEGTYFSNDRPIIAYYTPANKAGTGQGISFIGLGLGMFLGILLAGWISEVWGWRMVFFLFALPAFLAASLIGWIIKEPPQDTQNSFSRGRTPLSQAFKNRDLWLLYLGGIPAVYALWMIGAWAPAMLKEVGVRQLSSAALYSSLLGLSAVPGLILTGLISDRLARKGKGRKGLIATEFVLSGVFLFIFGWGIQARWNGLLLGILIFVLGVFVWGHWAAYYSLISEIVPKEILGSVYGITNSIHFIGGLLAPWLTGMIKDAFASFSYACYGAGLFTLIGSGLIFCVRPAFRWKTESPLRAH
ncbi:MAG: MFS transporter [Pseudomonadota bacterium]